MVILQILQFSSKKSEILHSNKSEDVVFTSKNSTSGNDRKCPKMTENWNFAKLLKIEN